MRASRLLILILVLLSAAGCMHRPAPVAVVTPGGELDAMVYGAPAGTMATGYAKGRVQPIVVEASARYTLDSGDKLRIVVFGQDGLTNSYAVDAAGRITMPLIGAVNARGLTPAELSGAIAGRLKQGFIREPHVAAEIEVYRPFFILGEVTTPGQYPYVANMTAETAIAIAGGFTPRASRGSVNVTRHAGGQTVRSAMPLNAPLRPGDTVMVDERWF
jgi:polysaccharide export outer membrane protein